MKEHVDIIKVPGGVAFSEALDRLKQMLKTRLEDSGLSVENLIWSRCYLTDPVNQLELLKRHSVYGDMLSKAAFSYVGQPLLDGSKVSLIFGVNLDAKLEKEGTPDKMIVRLGNSAEVMFHSVRLRDSEVKDLSACQQTELIFSRHMEWLKQRGMTLGDNCMRTWLYVRDIDRNYAGVMQGRNAVFAREGLTADTHYIASTGIGGYMADTQPVVGIDFYSVKQPGGASPLYLNALEYLNHTHEYGVAFERGAKIRVGGVDKVFISGTASIDKHGNCLYLGDVARQIERLFLNISKLLEPAGRKLSDITYMVVYLRDIADVQFVENYLKEHFGSTPHLVVEACVCRPQWLIEVECVTK